MIGRLHIAILSAGLAISGPASAGELQGSVEVIDGSTMLVAGQTVHLADIVVPPIGSKCVWRGQPLDCGVLARAGLKDITAGANVVCIPVGANAHRCKDGSFDLAFGLIHAGWAVPVENAPGHYHKKMQDAKQHKRALWSARDVDGTELIASRLRSKL
ncbi:MAG: thermonuclease family protein [Rhizobiales bacterium]|nr:thermonuclease family protein [Hyphomicrobiales bacterium]